MPLTLMPHVYEKAPGVDRFHLVRTIPYIRIANGNEQFFIQEGKIYAPDGTVPGGFPAWVKEEINKLTDAAKIEVGLKVDRKVE